LIVVCGEALVDVVGGVAYPGGSAANVAVALGRLGVDVALLTRISTDHYGQLLEEHLTAAGVQLSSGVRTAEPTTVARVELGPAGDAVYTFEIEGTTNGAWPELVTVLPADAILHVCGSFALARPAMGDPIEAMVRSERQHRIVTFDPNPRPTLAADPEDVRTRLYRWLALADVVKLSADDLAWVAPGESIVDTARLFQERGPELVVVTRGAGGAYALGPDGPVELPAEPVALVDTVGAGDAFMAGLLTCLRSVPPQSLTTADLTAALRFAQRVAALTCARVGADPPWRGDPGLALD
jgi:fructokinase